MKSPSVTFIAETVQEKGLKKTTTYRYYPSTVMREEIIQGVKDHMKIDLEDCDIIEVKVEVVMKSYEKKPTNDTKNT